MDRLPACSLVVVRISLDMCDQKLARCGRFSPLIGFYLSESKELKPQIKEKGDGERRDQIKVELLKLS